MKLRYVLTRPVNALSRDKEMERRVGVAAQVPAANRSSVGSTTGTLEGMT